MSILNIIYTEAYFSLFFIVYNLFVINDLFYLYRQLFSITFVKIAKKPAFLYNTAKTYLLFFIYMI